MKTIKKIASFTAIALLATLLITSCNKEDDVVPTNVNMSSDPQSIAQVANSNSNFSILAEALEKTGLADAAQGSDQLTVFAPTNEAFQQLFIDLGISSLDDLPALALRPILEYHILSGKAMSSSLSTGYFNTLNTSNDDQLGVVLFIETINGVTLNGSSRVMTADIEATNGVIHVINEVLLPPSAVDLALTNPSFSILVEAVVKANLVEALNGSGPFTIFAPTNAAFEDLFRELNVRSIDELSAEVLTPILLYHVASGNITSPEVTSGTLPTLNSAASLSINNDDRGLSINGSTSIIAFDVQGTNGVIHAIDKVLLPK